MKKLFVAIRQDDLATVKSLIEKNPDLVNCIAGPVPAKDEGQSPLQVALKTDALEIAEYLIDMGANINFIEADDSKGWRAPVIHDAIRMAVMNTRWNNRLPLGMVEVFSTKARADQTYALLERIIKAGADVNAKDSHGNSCINCLCIQSRLILPGFDYSKHKVLKDRKLTRELRADLSRIFILLREAGADKNYVAPNFKKTVMDYYAAEILNEFTKLL